jgi:LmbE family N-acetylglucosaminyl deacetylase
MKNPYRGYVSALLRAERRARALPLGGLAPARRPKLRPSAPRVLVFSPHPDDECIVGGLALRLLREARMRVVNVAVTQGSRKDRQEPRLQELRGACDFLGFDLATTVPGGLERVNPKARAEDPAHWSAAVATIAGLLREHAPRVILYPHEADWNSTHLGTHHLVVDALRSIGSGLACWCVETEFWGAMAAPNLMVEIPPRDLGDLIGALTFHVGEVQRNPYHIRLPAWMSDNVRRGGEVVGGQGGAAPDFAFATLYRVRRWTGAALEDAPPAQRFLAATEKSGMLFPML